MARSWQAADARHKFTEVVDGAVRGEPQFVRRRDGTEVVVVSRAYFDRTAPTLKSFLLTKGYAAAEDDAFDEALRRLRKEGSPFLAGEPAGLDE